MKICMLWPALAVAAVGLTATGAAPVADAPAPPAPPLHVCITGSSTLHDFAGQAAATNFACSVGDDAWSADASLAVADLDTGNAKRDRNLRAMFDAAAFPRIHGAIRAAALPAAATNAVPLALRIRDRTESVTASLTEWSRTPSQVAFTLSFDVSLKAFGLKAPSVIGLIRVADRVRVTCRVTAPLAPPQSP